MHALGIGEARPRISWTIERAPTDWRTSAYQLRMSADDRPDETSEWLAGAGQSLVAWPFEALRSRERVHIAVRVRSADGRESAWSPGTLAETGLLEPSDWVARLVTPAGPVEDSDLRRPPLVRHEFELPDRPVSARLYVTAHGLFEPYINGVRVGDDVLAPGWTVYPHRLAYSTYDVTELLQAGANALGAILGDGWYRGRLGSTAGNRDIYGDRLALLAQLEVELADGTAPGRGTEAGLARRAGPDPQLRSVRGREVRRPARLDQAGHRAGFDDTAWAGVEIVERDPATLVRAATGRRSAAPRSSSRASITRTDRDNAPGLRPEPRRATSHPGDGPEDVVVRLRHAEVLAGRRASTSARFAARSRSTSYMLGRRRAGVGAAIHLPRIPLRRGRRLARRARGPATSSRASCTPTCVARAASARRTQA